MDGDEQATNAEGFVLLRHCHPPPSDLINSLVSVPFRSNLEQPNPLSLLLLTSWPSNGVAVDVRKSLDDGQAVVTTELASRTVKGRITSAAVLDLDDQRRCWCFVSNGGKIVHITTVRLFGRSSLAGDVREESLPTWEDVHLRYETRTVGIGRRKRSVSGSANGVEEPLLITGGPRGAVVQTLPFLSLNKTEQVVAALWRKFPIRIIQVSPDGDYLLLCSATGDVGLFWLSDEQLGDDSSPVWTTRIPSAAISCASISPKTRNTAVGLRDEKWFHISISSWSHDPKPGNGKSARPLHYVFKVSVRSASAVEGERFQVVPCAELQFLQTMSATTRVSALLPPPALNAFSSCGHFLATTSSCSSVTVWELSTGRKASKWAVPTSSPGDEVCGLATVDVRPLGDIQSLLAIRTADGLLIAKKWPDARGQVFDHAWISRSCFLRDVESIPIFSGLIHDLVQDCIPDTTYGLSPQFRWVHGSGGDQSQNDRFVAVFIPRGTGRGSLTLVADFRYGLLVERFESHQMMGKDRFDPDNERIPIKIKLMNAVRTEDGDFVLRFRGADGMISTFEARKDIWRFVCEEESSPSQRSVQ